MGLDTKLFDDLHRILDNLGILMDAPDKMLLRNRVKEGVQGLQQEIKELKERNAILEHYADTTAGMWATDSEADLPKEAIALETFVKLEHPLPPEMREEQPS